MTREMCQLLTQEIKPLGGIQLAIHLGGPQFYQKNKYCCSFGVWQRGNRIVRSPTLGRETKPDIFCKWNTKFSIIPEIPSKRVHWKRIPKFSKTLPGIFTVPFNFGPEISEFLVEWKAPLVFMNKYLYILLLGMFQDPSNQPFVCIQRSETQGCNSILV